MSHVQSLTGVLPTFAQQIVFTYYFLLKSLYKSGLRKPSFCSSSKYTCILAIDGVHHESAYEHTGPIWSDYLVNINHRFPE